ncbi:alpha/beta hydrolase-fold protein [Bacillus sp. MUM 13]|uniref:alpha/beta hydrolase n=1 Tax=Bacillus sp. MUM 13 TaxID=1678001 RepID=UPI0009F19E34|nr:alpha/beta hydrolase-fold protein [Bacillus sp. MUM 13]
MIKKIHIPSNLLKDKARHVNVYLPCSYQEEKREYPVLYMHDGQNVFHDKEAIGGVSLGLEEYLENNKLEVIVAAIYQNSEQRMNEYCPWPIGRYSKEIMGKGGDFGGEGGKYAEFIVKELKPYIDTTFRTLPNETALAGISLGGLISLYSACKYPEIFRHIIVLSSAFFRNQEEIEKLVESSDLSSIKSFYGDCGTEEAGKDETLSKLFSASNQSVFELIKKKIHSARFCTIQGGEHTYSDFRKRVPELFTFL